MEEEAKKEKEEQQKDYNDYIEQIEKLKENTVDKAEYESLKAENKKLVETLATRKTNESTPNEEPKKDISKLWKEFRSIKSGDCKLWSNALEIRDETIKQEGYDPFTSPDKELSHNKNEMEAYENVAKVVKDCLEQAKGDDEVFRSVLKSRTYDDPSLVMYLKNKK